ncbi:MAG: HAMP domain-containing histidine kinase [Oscillospiraceae bacterium]|nr:HAMP domain-containing histidine kinase [Oscillospiraceae bacterium]
MRRSIVFKYFTAFAAIILSCILFLGVVFMLFASQYFRMDKQHLLYRNAQYALNLTKSNLESNKGTAVDEWVLKSAYSILADSSQTTVFLINTEGETMVCSESSNCVHKNAVMNKGILDELFTKGTYSEIGRLGGIYSSSHYTVAQLLLDDEGFVKGVIFVSAPANTLVEFLTEMMGMFIISATVVLFVAFICTYFLIGRMVRPLRKMADATRAFANGDFSVRVPVEGVDEIGVLAASINEMATSLAELEMSSRSFTANVSHELKTPMTTIGGFVDGILDGTIPEEKHRHYLTIVSEEIKRLSRLVKAMLQLAKIEAGERQIIANQFDIHDTVIQTVFAFEQVIESKDLEIRGLDVDKIMVEADEDLIHQVVYNLVDNAVKFTNQGGYIEFEFNGDDKMIYVAVRNSGDGIPENELNKLFDRFYKTDRSRSLDKNGVGLGLYIVRTVIGLHGGEIRARSKQGEFTEFEFSIPLSRNQHEEQNKPTGGKNK